MDRRTLLKMIGCVVAAPKRLMARIAEAPKPKTLVSFGGVTVEARDVVVDTIPTAGERIRAGDVVVFGPDHRLYRWTPDTVSYVDEHGFTRYIPEEWIAKKGQDILHELNSPEA